jgi:hypothetical protein
MQWQELNKESIESMKQEKLVFWCFVKDVAPYIHNLYKICLVTRVNNHPALGDYWFVLSVKNTSEQIRDSITDDDMLDFFSHYCIVDQPERSKREEVCTGKCSPTVSLVLLDEWPNPLVRGSVEKVRAMRCSEHCGNTVRDK